MGEVQSSATFVLELVGVLADVSKEIGAQGLVEGPLVNVVLGLLALQLLQKLLKRSRESIRGCLGRCG